MSWLSCFVRWKKCDCRERNFTRLISPKTSRDTFHAKVVRKTNDFQNGNRTDLVIECSVNLIELNMGSICRQIHIQRVSAQRNKRGFSADEKLQAAMTSTTACNFELEAIEVTHKYSEL